MLPLSSPETEQQTGPADSDYVPTEAGPADDTNGEDTDMFAERD